jgi:type VI protein secretion system component VasK
VSLVLRRFRVYAKLVLLVALAVVIGLVIFFNRSHTVDVWFFASYQDINVVWLLICTAVGSILAWWIVTRSVGLWRDVKELSREAERKKADQEQRDMTQKMAETEKRIDRKLKKGVTEEEAPPNK